MFAQSFNSTDWPSVLKGEDGEGVLVFFSITLFT